MPTLAGASGVGRYGLPIVKLFADVANRPFESEIELIRSTPEGKGQQIANFKGWQASRNGLAPAGETDHAHVIEDDSGASEPHDGHGLGYLQQTARDRKNVFEALMEAVKTHSLGQISHALYDVGGEYRRNM